MSSSFVEVTEIAGEPISGEALYRLHHRYRWAASRSRGKDVAEVACGVGPGLGMLSRVARSVEAGDISAPIVEVARRTYADRINVVQLDACAMPYADGSKDVILLFEAIYYMPDVEAFVRECKRVLRPGGEALIVTANKDLWDFHPSAYSHRYFGTVELQGLLSGHGFDCEFVAIQRADQSSLRQRILRPLKRLAVMTGLMPRTMAGKRWLKKIVFGREVPMPAELREDAMTYEPPQTIPGGEPDRRHKIIYCAARLPAA